jgi:hypothetical protein
MEILGHRDPRQHLSPGHLRDAIRTLDQAPPDADTTAEGAVASAPGARAGNPGWHYYGTGGK